MRKKILSLVQADAWFTEQRVNNLSIGFTCGAFDLLHAGHIEVLAKTRSQCNSLIVAVNSDESIRSYKSPLRPIVPEKQRMQVVSSLEFVDAVVKLDHERPLRLIERWRPDFYFKGGDYSQNGLRSSSFVESYGGKIVVIPF